jgi:two-component system chemotaxis response regulator CheB/two-component system response regulator YesN
MKILIVDDLKLIRDLIRTMVARLQFISAIEEAEDVSQALRAVDRLQPDVVTLDMQLPGGTGLNVLQAIKQAHHVPSVIVVTNQADPQTRKACMAAGASFFLDKSLDMEQLPAILNMLTGESQGS